MPKRKKGQKSNSSDEVSTQTQYEEPTPEENENGTFDNPDVSLCDSSFREDDAVPTSTHVTISKCTESLENFLAAVKAHTDKNDDFDFEESLTTLTADELKALWVSLHQYLNISVDDDDNENKIECLIGVALVARMTVSLETVSHDSCPLELISAASYLHSSLPDIHNLKIENRICQFLESWFLKDLPNKDLVILNVLLWLLTKALGDHGAKADVKRLWNIHQTLLEHRLADSGRLEKLLILTASSNTFLTSPEGIRWLVFLFSLSPEFVTRLHKEARNNLVKLSKSACLGLGEVYHKAWMGSGGEFRVRLEMDCIQDLIYRGVVATRVKGGVSSHVARVLSYFQRHESSQPTKNMLSRLYEPVLFRYLKVANENVRLNACELFTSNYPLEDMDASVGERENSLFMQHNFIMRLLRDVQPSVRCKAVRDVCRLLADYWPIIPSEIINQIINIIFKELVWDSSHPKVRVMAIAGVGTILSAPQSHVYMKAILPRLSECLHDSHEAVRASFVDLLQKIKGIRSIKFWNVCPVEHLLARMEKDKAYICRRILNLLFNSYFPLNQSDEVKLNRCIHMIKTNKKASRKFYQYATENLDAESTMIFMLNILTSVKIWIRARTGANLEQDDKENNCKKRRKLYSNSDSEMMSEDNTENSTVLETTNSTTASAVNSTTAAAPAEEEVEEEHEYDDPSVVSGILDIVCVMWRTKITDMSQPENDEMRSALEKKAGKWMTLFFKYFKSSPVISTIVYLSSYLPERAVAHVASYCLARVKDEEGWQTHVDCLCNWRKGNRLLELIIESFKSVMIAEDKSCGNNKGVRFAESDSKDNQLKVAIKLVHYLLEHQTNRILLLYKHKPVLEELMQVSARALDYITTRLGFNDKSGTSPSDIAQILLLYGQLSVMLDSKTALSVQEELLSWSEREVLPVLVLETRDSRTRDQVSLALHVLQAINKLQLSIISLGLGDADHANSCLDWNVTCLIEAGASQVESFMSMLSVAAVASLSNDCEIWKQTYQVKIPVCVAKFLNWLTSNVDDVENESEILSAYQHGLLSLFKVYERKKLKNADSWEDLMDVSVAAVLALMSKKFREEGELSVDQHYKVATTFVTVLCKVAGVESVGEVVARMLKDYQDEEEKGPTLAAYFSLATVVNSKNKDAIYVQIREVIQEEIEKDHISTSNMEYIKELEQMLEI